MSGFPWQQQHTCGGRGGQGPGEQKRAKRLGFSGKSKATEGKKSEGLGRLKQRDPSSMRRVKDNKKPEEVRKQRVLELQEKQRISREQQLTKRKNLYSFQNDILQRQRDFEIKEVEMQNLEKHVNFENENSRKAYYREFKK
ncbi:hypothetical protein CRUP_013788, partial [Coryphaenoides rupestris]